MPTPSDALDRAISQARDLRIDDEYVRSRSEELVRWTRRAEVEARERSRRRWWWGAGLGLAAAAAAVAVLAVPRAPGAASPVVQIGARVAISSAPNTRYTVVRSADDRTEIEVAAGAVTARLYAGASAHHLRLRAGSLEAVATGTIYTVAAPEGGAPYAQVHEGRVQVRVAQSERVLEAGQTWPSPAVPSSAVSRSVAQLKQHALAPSPPREAAISDGSAAGNGAGSAASSDAGSDAGSATGSATAGSATASHPGAPAPAGPAPTTASSAAPTAADRWQRARQLRAQGHAREALALLDELSATTDATWAPLALVESIRIHASVLGDPAAVVRLSQSFLSRHPSHALAREVTEMLCRAHRERGDTELPSACLLR